MLYEVITALVISPFVAMSMMISAFLSDISAMIVAIVYVLFSIVISAISIFIDMLPKSIEATLMIFPPVCCFTNCLATAWEKSYNFV